MCGYECFIYELYWCFMLIFFLLFFLHFHAIITRVIATRRHTHNILKYNFGINVSVLWAFFLICVVIYVYIWATYMLYMYQYYTHIHHTYVCVCVYHICVVYIYEKLKAWLILENVFLLVKTSCVVVNILFNKFRIFR